MSVGCSEINKMKLLFVHERFGAFAGAESNILATANELNRRGHVSGLLHGAVTGKGERIWEAAFPFRVALGPSQPGSPARAALKDFRPDAVYVHKMADLEVIKELLGAGVPLVRMIHDHDLYCLRSYKYNYFTRRPCERPASLFCLFPCGGFLARDSNSWFPLKWVSYLSKLEEIQLNRKFDRLIVASQFMKEELLRNGFAP